MKDVVSTYDKLYSVEKAHKCQNGRYWSAMALAIFAIVEYRQNLQYLIVWSEICTSSNLLLSTKDLKLIKIFYQPNVFEAIALSWAQQPFGIKKMDVSTTLHPVPRGEKKTQRVVQSKLSRFYFVWRMAILLSSSNQ